MFDAFSEERGGGAVGEVVVDGEGRETLGAGAMGVNCGVVGGNWLGDGGIIGVSESIEAGAEVGWTRAISVGSIAGFGHWFAFGASVGGE